MTDRTRNRHPTDLELAAWVDEPELGPDLSAHLETCALCRDRAAELSATRAGIAIDPPMPTDAAFAAQRQRILAAIEEAPRGSGRVIRRIGWLVPLAAAAGIAAIVLIDRPDGSPPGTASATVVAEAEAAAEEAAAIMVAEQELDAALAAAGGLTPSASIERSASIEAEFTLLSEAEQSAVLRELERSDFDL